MKKKSVKRNYIYNLILTFLNLFFPLLTSPYVSRILGASNIGKVNYAMAISNWFILIASYGIPTYGIREIARWKDNKKELSITFWDLLIIKGIFTLAALLIYTVIIIAIPSFHSEVKLFLSMNLLIVLNIFTIDWFYQGIEEYSFITIRSIIIKVFSLILIFLMIKHRNDYTLYAFITIFATAFNNILNYLHSKKYVTYIKHKIKFKRYISQLNIFFFSALVISIYSQFDQVILGSLSGAKQLAYYVRSKQITSIGMSLTSSLTTVLIPQASYLYKTNYNQYKSLLQKSINYIYIISIPCIVGLFLLSKEIMYLFGGSEFLPASTSLSIISFTIIIIAIGTWQFNQVLLPSGDEKLGVKLQILIAVLSLCLSFIMVPILSYIGSSIAILLTELVGTLIGVYIINNKYKELHFRYITRSLIKYLISSLFMILTIIIIKYSISGLILRLIISIIISPIVYYVAILLLRDDIVIDLTKDILIKILKRK